MPDQENSPGLHVEAPRIVGGRAICPRCGARLRFDGEELMCLACGYEREITPAARQLVGASRRPLVGVSAIAAPMVATAGLLARTVSLLTLGIGAAVITGVAVALFLSRR